MVERDLPLDDPVWLIHYARVVCQTGSYWTGLPSVAESRNLFGGH